MAKNPKQKQKLLFIYSYYTIFYGNCKQNTHLFCGKMKILQRLRDNCKGGEKLCIIDEKALAIHNCLCFI